MTPPAMHHEVVDFGVEMQGNIGVGLHRFDEHGLQIAAMDHPVGCAVALLDGSPERSARKDAGCLPVHDPELLRGDDMAQKGGSEAERNQDA